jgi:hypothetical protein
VSAGPRKPLGHRLGAWLESRSWWAGFADWIERRVLTPPWERRERPIAALKAALVRIAADERPEDLPLLREIEWSIWVTGGEK